MRGLIPAFVVVCAVLWTLPGAGGVKYSFERLDEEIAVANHELLQLQRRLPDRDNDLKELEERAGELRELRESLAPANGGLSGTTAGRARVVLTSGGEEPVIDIGGVEGHSVFTSALLKTLSSTNEPFDGTPLGESVEGWVGERLSILKKPRVPRYENRPCRRTTNSTPISLLPKSLGNWEPFPPLPAAVRTSGLD